VNFAVSVFKFFASLRFALFLLCLLGLVFALGTFVESGYSTETAKLLVYRSPWLSLLLILLALNVAASALDRLPWKKKHVGFVVTHAGIVVILAGSLLTRAYGVEGQLAIEEGKTEGRIVLDEAVVQVFSGKDVPLASYPVRRRPFAWKGRERLGTEPNLWLLHYYPKSSRRETVEEALNGPAALRVHLESSFLKMDQWLVLEDPERSVIPLGPADLRFTRDKIVPPQAASEVKGDFLEFRFKDSSARIPLPQELSKKLPLKGTPYQVTILRVLKDAMVDQGELLDRSEEWNNPAIELLLEGKGLQERHTVFSNFPDFPTIHGMKPSDAGVEIVYQRAEAGSRQVKNELRFVWREEGPPLFQLRKGEAVTEGEVKVGEEHATGWMDFKFRTDQYFAHSRVTAAYHEEPIQSESDQHASAVEIELEYGGERASLWLGQGEVQEVTLQGKKIEVLYGLRTHPLGFRLELKDFRVRHYPGTNQPASFESDVTFKDDFRGISRDLTIRMNEPLKHRGFKVFQSGYQQPEGGPEVSIFTVAKDPGIPVKYAGALILVGGIATMFYTRRFSTRPERVR
jgi:hypothetical protein